MGYENEVARPRPKGHSRWDDEAGALVIHQIKRPMSVASMAMEIIKAHAMVVGMPDGEDSAGRQKMRLPTTEELVTRACDLAAEMWQQFEKRGWIMDLPLPPEEEAKPDEEAA